MTITLTEEQTLTLSNYLNSQATLPVAIATLAEDLKDLLTPEAKKEAMEMVATKETLVSKVKRVVKGK